jgi:hypothetical protein
MFRDKSGAWKFKAIILREPEVSDVQSAKGGACEFVRIDFKIWPGQGSLIETTFRQRLTTALKQFDPNYADWMVGGVSRHRPCATKRFDLSQPQAGCGAFFLTKVCVGWP